MYLGRWLSPVRSRRTLDSFQYGAGEKTLAPGPAGDFVQEAEFFKMVYGRARRWETDTKSFLGDPSGDERVLEQHV